MVAKGYAQIKGVDYDDTYSPVVRFTTLCILFTFAARERLDVYHLDVETAFLRGTLEETVYLEQPQGFIQEKQEDHVCLLHKALYGLKQGSRAWNRTVNDLLKKMNMAQSAFDTCVYYYANDRKLIIIALFVDDFLVFTNSIDFYSTLKEGLTKEVPVKDLGIVRKCLGINIHIDKNQGIIELDQTDYIESILQRFSMSECKGSSTPMEPGSQLNASISPINPQESERLRMIPYQNAVGALLYLVQATRPDLAYSVSTVSRFNQNYDDSHWAAVKRIMRYLQTTKNYRLRYNKMAHTKLVAYCDASWAADYQDGRSTTGYIFLLQGGPISWNSRKQSTVALSSTQAEYMALSSATQEALWLRGLTIELTILGPSPVIIHSDNKGVIDLAKNAHFSSRTRHISIKHYFIKQSIDDKLIEVRFVTSFEMLADTLTKATPKGNIEGFSSYVGLLKSTL